LIWDFALSSVSADEGKTEEVEGLELAKPALLAVFRRKASACRRRAMLRSSHGCRLDLRQ
jgi:hypothetical protein